MIPVEAWQTLGALLAALTALGGGAFALQRLGIIRSRGAAPAPPAASGGDDVPDRLAAIESRLAVVEERSRSHERALEGIGRLHGRIDRVAETTQRIEGEISALHRTLTLVMRHLLGESDT